ncbi:MAG TPA: methylated-DNA--[protein]-cysteine S-methyltransferase, partial [Candidatus Limnocylindria bacterium]|nr:methylated-DNA--[protein]-cysteine S-methyltransferase [Candidatus Limnocylindria bacterium]
MATSGRHLIRGMRTLREPAPADLHGNVLDAVGLTDAYAEIDGPIGPLFVAFGRAGISLVERAVDAGAFEEQYRLTVGRPLRRVERLPREFERYVAARLAGQPARTRRAPVDLARLPEFERQVLLKTLEIPHGEVRPYAWVAAEVGRPLAVRAVGNALARNPLPFVVPCHRVVRSDGRLGQYGAGGPAAKRAVLAAEGLDTQALERLPAVGVRFIGSDTTNIFCYPSCHNARRISPRHRVSFRSVDETRRAGFRACRACRPVEA